MAPPGGVRSYSSAVLAVLLSVPWFGSAFNVDLESMSVYQGPAASHFGYTVELLINRTGKWVLVGSPTAQPNHEPKINRTGAVYMCDTEQGGQCKQMRIDTEGNSWGSLEYTDRKENQWLGSSLALSYDSDPRLVACAPKWKNVYYPKRYLAQGLCYDVTDGKTEELRPLLNKALQIVNGVHYYLYAQAGFSVTFAKGKTGHKSKLIMGAPNLNNGEGGVVIYEDTANNVFEVQPLLGAAAYAGYAVASGNIYGPGKVSHIIGAPVHRNVGRVYVIDNKRYEVNDSRMGFQFGEYFGASLCTVDFDGDSLDEVVVGAPLYSSVKYPDVGRVYVWPNRGKGMGLSLSHVTLTSPGVHGKPRARFGQAVASIGDINRDGYEDLAVGAPYEDDHVGAVYIYNGGPAGVNPDVSQRIVGKDGIQTFGWSISRGQDMDANGYPDFAVGAYHTNHAVLFRSRPVVKIDGKLEVVPSVIDYKQPSPIIISVSMCLSYSGVQAPQTLNASYKLEADTLKRAGRRSVRASFDMNGTRRDSIDKHISVHASRQTCENISTYVNLDTDVLSPIQFDVNFRLVEEPANPGGMPPPIADVPQGRNLTAKASFQNDCGADDLCVTDLRVTFAEINPEGSAHFIIGQTSVLALHIQVSNAGEPAYEALLTVSLPPRVTYIGGGKNLGPVVYSPNSNSLAFHLGNPLAAGKNATLTVKLNVDKVIEVTTHLTFKAVMTSTSHENITLVDNHASVTVQPMYDVELVMESRSFPEQFTYNPFEDENLPLLNLTQKLSLQNTGPSLLPAAEITISIPVKKPEAPSFYLDPADIEVFMWNETFNEPVGCAVSDSFLLPSGELVESEELTFSTAKALTTEDVTEVSREVTQAATLQYIEPQRLNQVENKTAAKENRQVTLSCSAHQCAVVTCQMGQLLVGQTVQVNVSLRVDQTALYKRKERASVLLVTSFSVQRKSKLGLPRLLDDRRLETRISTAFHPSAPPQEELAVWIIIVAAIGALLLLLLLLLILAKLGFFRRKKHAEVQDWKRKSGYSRRSRRPVSSRASTTN